MSVSKYFGMRFLTIIKPINVRTMVESKPLEVPHAFGTILYVMVSIICQYASLVNKKLSVLFLLQSH